MSNRYEPEAGAWYKDEDGMSFEVIHVDQDDGNVEVQYFDGSVAAIDLDSWYLMAVSRRAPPEDWSGPYDDIEPEDLDETEAAMRPHSWSGPLDSLEIED